MDENQLQELRDLITFLKVNEIAEFDMERPDLKVRIKFSGGTIASLAASERSHASQLATPIAAAGFEAARQVEISQAEEEIEEKLHTLKSPIVGTFYESPSPGAPAFVKVGDQVEIGQVLCIVEAMKLMNEIEADMAGEVVKRIAITGQPVEYGQPLFAIRPR